MKIEAESAPKSMDSVVVAGIGLAAFYWVCESFMYFFLSPESNFFHHLLGPDLFNVWTRILVLCCFAIFGSHMQQSYNKRRMADRQLREQDEKYRLIVESIEEGVYEVNLQGNFTFFNESVCRILGYSRKELIGMNHRVYTSAENADKMYRTINQVYQTGVPAKITDYEVIRKDGTTIHIEMSTYLMRNAGGDPIGFRGVVRDISERLRTEMEKRKLESQLQQAQKMEAIGNLAGGIAHDFNNILMGMQGNASLMLMNMDPDDPFHEKVRSIERYVESGAALTKQLLGFARGGKYQVKATDLNDLIDKTAKMFGRTKKEIQIHTDQLRNIWNVEVDQSQIEQVLLNLFINAWHAMPSGGDLVIETENTLIDGNTVKPYKVNPGRYVKISVSDNGSGMDKATQSRIFEPFFTTKEMGHGTGLGLAAAYGIIKNHGGFIDVYSEVGHGATFHVYLPASEKTVVAEVETVEKLLMGTETVLLIEDEEMVMEVGRELLAELGYTVLSARSGREALEVIKDRIGRIDLVILDMIMPGMSGGETFDEIKKIDPQLRVLLSSGYSISGQASDILARGCDGFIQKPFKVGALSNIIREILDASKSRPAQGPAAADRRPGRR